MTKWIKSLKHALNGLYNLFTNERNAQIEAVLGLLAIAAGIVLGITKTEWFIVLLCCASVLSLEALNTALEKTLDQLHPQKHPSIGLAKDLAAAAVLIASIASFIAGVVIFYPYVVK